MFLDEIKTLLPLLAQYQVMEKSLKKFIDEHGNKKSTIVGVIDALRERDTSEGETITEVRIDPLERNPLPRVKRYSAKIELDSTYIAIARGDKVMVIGRVEYREMGVAVLEIKDIANLTTGSVVRLNARDTPYDLT